MKNSDRLNEQITEGSHVDENGGHILNKEGIKVGSVFKSMVVGGIGFLQFGKFSNCHCRLI